jgi:hypothetical protein
MSNYSTITNESMLRAIGPFRETLTWQADGNFLTQMQARAIYTQPFGEPQQAEVAFPIHFAVQQELLDSAYATMLASEAVLAQAWDTPEDDAAWADL